MIKSPIFRFGHDCNSTSSARSPCYFRLQADFAIWILRKVCKKHYAYPNISNSWEELEVSRQPCSGFPHGSDGLRSSTKFSVNSCSQSGNSCDKPLCSSSRPSFLFLILVSVDSCNGFLRSSSFVLPLLFGTGFSMSLLSGAKIL